MVRASLGTTIFIVGRDEELWDEQVHRARAAGAQHLKIFLEYPPGNGELRQRQIRRLQNLVKGLRTLVHVPVSWPSLITPHERLYRLSLQEIKDTLTVAVKLSAELVTFLGGPIPFSQFRHGQDASQRFKQGVGELLPLAHELGQPLAIENLAAGYPSSPEELEEALAAGLKLSLNVDQVSKGGRDPLDLLKEFRERVAEVVIGSPADWELLVGYLKGASFAGFLTLNVPPGPERWSQVQELLIKLRGAWEGE